MQDFIPPWEIVIADDYSTDGTREILIQYAQQYPNKIRLLTRSNNLGAGPNFIDLILQAKGKYIAYLEGDDYWCDPSKLTQQVAYLDANCDASLTWHGYHLIDEMGNLTTKNAHLKSKLDYTAAEFKKINGIKSLTICFRNVIRQFPENYLDCPNGDTYLYTLLGAFGDAKFIETIIPSCYRVHAGGTWSQIIQINKDKKAIQSFRCIAAHSESIGDLDTRDYYLDRLFKTAYVLAHQQRLNGNLFDSIKIGISLIRLALTNQKTKWLPTIFVTLFKILFKKEIFIWQHRTTH